MSVESGTKACGAPHWTRIVRDSVMGRYLFQHEYSFADQWLRTAGPPRRILDLCCGSGSISLLLHDSGLSVVGIDREALALAEVQQQTKKIPLVRGDGRWLPFAHKSFDCVIAIECFEYFTDYHKFLEEANRVLRTGGMLVFDGLNRRGYKWQLRMLLGRSIPYPSPSLSCGELLRAA